MNTPSIAIIGGGLAGCECAHALARAGIRTRIFEMKPDVFSEAHVSPNLAELVCSNSFRSNDPLSAVGRLKAEMRRLDSLCMAVAEETAVPAGKALAVDRERFSAEVTRRIAGNPLIDLERVEILSLDPEAQGGILAPYNAVVVAAGPLAGQALVQSLRECTGEEHLYFYDAIAPVVDGASLNMDIAFWGARYQPDDHDYLNCPLNKEEYTIFWQALLDGKTFQAREFEKEVHFEGCMPIEALAARGEKTLAFGPFKPVGFTDPRTGRRPYALLQLRAENANKTMFNLVGCQTKLTQSEQRRVFRLIPGLERAEFARYGSMHRNTFVNAPKTLNADLSLKSAPRVHLAGQITGVEGYVESAACGLWLGKLLAARATGRELPPPPPECALGALLGHLRTPAKHFQPSNIQFGLMPALDVRAGKADRKALYASRAEQAFRDWLDDAYPPCD
jgi:methylenetetrahydrofolate--tRNA-(uracil-5-)-methyltransferase